MSNRKAKLISRLAICVSRGRGITHLERMCFFQSQSAAPALFVPHSLSSCALRGSLRPEDFDATTHYAVQVPEKARQPAQQWLLSFRPLTYSVVHVTVLVSEEGVLPSLLN